MASACSNFRPNLWRPSTCANCYRHKSKHAKTSPEEKSPQIKTKENSGKPPEKAVQCMAEVDGKQIGIVKPYAIVDIPNERRFSDPNILSRPNGAARSNRNDEKVRSSSVSTFGKRSLTPKRKAPPPPPPKPRSTPSPKPRKTLSPHPLRRNTVSQSRPSPTSPQLQRNRATTHVGSRIQVHPSRNSPSHSSLVQRNRARSAPQERLDYKEKASTAPQGQPHESNKANTILQERPHQKETTTSTTSHEQTHQRKRSATLSQSQEGPFQRERSATVARSNNISHAKPKKIPPQKPPRTLSTFISTEDQEALLQQLLSTSASTAPTNLLTVPQQPSVPQQNGLCRSPDVEPPSPCHELERSGSSVSCGGTINHERSVSTTSTSSVTSPTSSVFVSTGHLHSQMVQLMETTLKSVYESSISQIWCKESMWRMQWQDLEVLSSKTVGYKGILFSIECCTEEMAEGIQHEVKLSQLLSPHMNISLIRTILNTTTTNDVLPKASNYLVRDCINGGLLSQVLSEKRKSLSPEAYLNTVLLCLIQVFSAMAHLHDLGLCHRDIGLDCLYVTEYGSDWIVRLGNFYYALHRPGPVNATTFTYGYKELKWLGGADSRLPPEIMNTPENTQTLDYSHTDRFAAGCLIYEMMGHNNPFEQDPQLVYQQYTSDNLPCTLPPTLQRFADMLLCRDPSRRLGASTALLIAQTLLWLPPEWTKEDVSETVIRHHLSYEKALLVSTFATTTSHPLPLSLVLKTQFFSTCDSFEVNRTLSLFY